MGNLSLKDLNLTPQQRQEIRQGLIKKKAAAMFGELQQFVSPEKAKAIAIWCVHQLENQYEHLFPTTFNSDEEKKEAEIKYDSAMKGFDDLRAAIKAF